MPRVGVAVTGGGAGGGDTVIGATTSGTTETTGAGRGGMYGGGEITGVVSITVLLISSGSSGCISDAVCTIRVAKISSCTSLKIPALSNIASAYDSAPNLSKSEISFNWNFSLPVGNVIE